MKILVAVSLLASGFAWGQKVDVGFDGGAAFKPPFYFSVRVPEEGNYRVTVTLGDRRGGFGDYHQSRTATAHGGEGGDSARRVRQAHVHGEHAYSAVPGGGEVRLKDREKTSETWAWDDRITLEFTNTHPAVSAIEIEKADVPTFYIAGDSTSTDQRREPFNSWGQMLPRFFKPEIAVANHGEIGRIAARLHRRAAAGEIDERDQAGRLAVDPDGPQRPEGEGRGRRRVHHL